MVEIFTEVNFLLLLEMIRWIRFLFVSIPSRFRSDKKPDTGFKESGQMALGPLKKMSTTIMSKI